MFTGLVRDVGTVLQIVDQDRARAFRIQSRLAAACALGDSIAVDGACLTVTALQPDTFAATAVPETLARTTLGQLAVGGRVHLEPALRVGDALGGHIVQGHVDGTAVLAERRSEGKALALRFRLEAVELARYVAEKGSLAVQGVSLTVTGVDHDSFSVVIVPHTQNVTLLGQLGVGDRVNVEVDVLAKYVERLLRGSSPSPGGAAAAGGGVDEALLRRTGFIR